MEIIIICSIIAVIIIILITILTIKYNNFQYNIIKLNRGEINILNLLEKKYNILTRYLSQLKENIEINDDLSEYEKINFELPIKDINDKLNNLTNIINIHIDNNEKVLKDKTIINIKKELSETNDMLSGVIKYYNDNLVLYENLRKSFPSKIIAKICRYKEKDFIEEEEHNDLKILSTEEKTS